MLKGLLSYCVLSRADIFGYFFAPKAMYVCSGQQCCTHLGHCHSHLVELLYVGLQSVGAVDGRGTFVALFLMGGGKPTDCVCCLNSLCGAAAPPQAWR